MQRRAVAFLLVAILWPSLALAQSAPPQLIPGGSDRAFNVLGISSGMGCDAARAILGGHPQESRSSSHAVRVRSVVTTLNVATIVLRGKSEQGEIEVRCTGAASGQQVYFVERTINFLAEGEDPGAVKAKLQEKYGAIVREMRHDMFVTSGFFYNAAGLITDSASEACGYFFHDGPDGAMAGAMADLDPNRCSYAIYINLFLDYQRPPRVRMMSIRIMDYMRFLKAEDIEADAEAKRLQAVPSSIPRL